MMKITKMTTIEALISSVRLGQATLFISASTEIRKVGENRHLHQPKTGPNTSGQQAQGHQVPHRLVVDVLHLERQGPAPQRDDNSQRRERHLTNDSTLDSACRD